jgi:hypothetical protein
MRAIIASAFGLVGGTVALAGVGLLILASLIAPETHVSKVIPMRRR